MRTVALDVGSKTIGVAVSDRLGMTAQRVTTVKRAGLAVDLARLVKLFSELEAQRVLVGLPLALKGEMGPQAKKVLQFVEAMKEETNLPVVLWDERFSTVAAEKILLEADLSRSRRKKLRDELAAVLILQSYLDSQWSGNIGHEES
ncbi:MAG: Holliday junction resolvase RuvX [Thermodesulfobacteriota bacterium]